MSSPWGDDEDDDHQMSDQPASTTTTTATTTTTTSPSPTSPQPKSSVTSQLLGLTGRANSIEHVPKIQADTDYLYRLIRQQDQSDEFGAAINAWSTVYPGVKLLLPDGCINPAVFSNNATLPEGTIPIIETAVNVGNSRALMAIIKWYLDQNQPMQTSIVLSLLTTKQSEDVLNLFFAHSERFIQTNLTGNDLLQYRIEPIQFQTPQRTTNIAKCVELIGTHNSTFDSFLDSYIQQYKLPPFNSCGYILNGIVALYAPKSTSSSTTTTTAITTMTDATTQEQCTLQFTYKNNQSLFRYALECNNLTAFSKLLNRVSISFPQSTLVPALFDILSLETRLELVPSMVARIISGIKTSAQRELILEQLLRHPITNQSIYDVLFEKVLNLQVLHAEYEADELLNKSTNNNTQQTSPAQLLPTSPQIFHAFTQLLQAVVCINHLVLEAQSVKDANRRSALLAAYTTGNKTDPAATTTQSTTTQTQTQSTTPLSASIDSASYQLNEKMISMCTSFSKSLVAILKQTSDSTIFKNVKINLVQEFTLSTFIQFIPYFTPQGLIVSLAMIPDEFHTTLNELLPKLPIIYFRPTNNATPFHVHKALYDYRTRPQQQQQQQQGQPPQQPPQILTSTHLRLPSYLTVLNTANSPTNPEQAAALYRVHNWDNVAIKTFQEARLALYNTQLKPTERKQVHPILLLKFHPITIIQALYLCLDEPPGVGFIDNPVFALLLQQLASTPVSSADEVMNHSIISRRDSPKIKKLIDSKAFIPTQILPILTPTVTDFAYACISRPQSKTATTQSKSETAYYIAYFFDLVTTLKLLPHKDYTTFLKTITKNQYDSIVDVRDAINGWVPTGIGQGKNQINTGIRLLTNAFMSHQSDASIQRLMTNFDATLAQHTTYASQSLIVDNNDEPIGTTAMNSSAQRFIPPDFSTDRFNSSSINSLLSKLGSLTTTPAKK